jgi:catechol 2,3-dioxygenase-like lactoylglutathione lyase family enzyme
MFDHVTIRAGERGASERFYALVLAPLGVEKTASGDDFDEWNDFSIAHALVERPLTRWLHIGFSAPSRAHVDEFWRAGREAGYADDGAPGPRPEYGADYYGGFLLDPDGNSAEAVHHDSLGTDGVVDHVWMRVRDLEASARFYEAVARDAGFTRRDRTGRAQFAGTSGSLSLLAGERPTENVHLAFAAAAGDGLAQTLEARDPDGNTVEVVRRAG